MAASADKGGTSIRGRVEPVNAGAADLRDISANNSPSVVRNPVRPAEVVVVNRIDTPSFSCAMNVSADGGSSFTPSTIPFPDGEEQPPRCFAPDVAFGPDGRLALSFVTLAGQGNTPHAAWVATSGDGGRTLSNPVRVVGPRAFQVRVAADPGRPGRLYLSWAQASETGTFAFAGDASPVMVARSDDWGLTWGPPVAASAPVRTELVAPSAAVGPRGDLYVLYLDLGDDPLDYRGGHEGRGGDPFSGRWSLVLARSSDEGSTWTEAVVDDAVVPIERVIVLFPAAPSLAIDPSSGRVLVAFHDGRSGDSDVLLWSSPDGTRFAKPVRVNDSPAGDGRWQYLPKVAVAPTGRVDVVYYDRRADPGNVFNQVSLQSSTDGGSTFGPRVGVSDKAFDSGIGFGSERGMPDLGSRLGLVSSEGRALAVWTDTRAGTQASNKQDLGRAVVEFRARQAWRAPLLGLGLSGALGGLILMVVAALRRPPSPAPVAEGAGPSGA